MVQPPWFSGKWQNDFSYYHMHRVNKNSKKWFWDWICNILYLHCNKTILPVQSFLWLLLNNIVLTCAKCFYNLDLLFRNQECILLLDYIILLVFCIKRKTNGRLIYFMLILPAYWSWYCRQIFVMLKTSYSIFCGKSLVYNNILCGLQLTFSVETVVYCTVWRTDLSKRASVVALSHSSPSL